MNSRKYWSGKHIQKLQAHEIFVYGANPEFRNGAGAAKAAVSFGAKPYGSGRGIVGQTYGLITKNLIAGFKEEATGIIYDKEGFCSVSQEMIKANIDELYQCAIQHPDKTFLITYQYETFPNGTPKKSLNGYNSQEMLETFVRPTIPENIVFHDSYQSHLEKIFKLQQPLIQEYTYFFQATSPFSQWHPSFFVYRDLNFICTEQFMMYSKARTFNDPLVADKLMNIEKEFIEPNGTFKTKDNQRCYELILSFKNKTINRTQIVENPQTLATWKTVQGLIKKLGREVKNYNEEIWVSKRVNVVSIGNREKYNQNPDLKDILMNTQHSIMVEASPYDKIWGIGLDENAARTTPPHQWPGANLLGRVLTDLKTYYKNQLAIKTKRNTYD